MNRRFGTLCVSALLVMGLAGCEKFQARTYFKQGNAFYLNENYRAAIQEYQTGLALDPSAKMVWRSVGLAAMAVYRPGDPATDNLQFARTAVDAFHKYLEAFPNDEKVKDYLLNILMNAGMYDEALTGLKNQLAANPSDRTPVKGIVAILIKAKRLDDALDFVEQLGPKADSASLYTVGVACWDKSYHDPMIDHDTRARIVDRGMSALDKALSLDSNSFETMVYINLLFREKAKLELDPEKAQEWYAKATEWQDKAKKLRDEMLKKPKTS
ncbi:MAG: tetratricopeptide repeat protein [Thermoanaerobaculia bacterium]